MSSGEHLTPPAEVVRRELNRVLEDPSFRRSGRLSEFLRFVVEQTLEGTPDSVKEYTVGVAVYRKGATFDPRNDSTVRVEAARLRAKLREYYESGGRDCRLRIELPKGTYVPVFRLLDEGSGKTVPGKAPSSPRLRNRLLAALALAALSIAGGLIARVGTLRETSGVHLPTPLTTSEGREMHPFFSPDGSRIVFAWSGPEDDNFDLYVAAVDGGAPVRLTNHPDPDLSPAWSPDGRWIAFFRGGSAPGFYVIAATGEEERLISPAHPDRVGRALDWLPNSRSLIVADRNTRSEPYTIQHLFLATGERRRLTSPDSGAFGDNAPAVSPDGRMFAFTRSQSFPVNEILVSDVSGGKPKQLTFDGQVITGLTWSEDGGSIIFSSEKGGSAGAGSLWRVPVGGGVAEQIPGIGTIASGPAVSRTGRMLAFQTSLLDTNVWRIRSDGSRAKVIASTRQDQRPRFAPDGSRIAFTSNRTGNWEIWAANADGSKPVQLTFFSGAPARYPRWSPDGRWIAFDYRGEGNSDLYVIAAEGGTPRRVTHDPASDNTPDWSKDGQWLYFSSNRSGPSELWKVPVATGEAGAVRMTEDGGSWPALAPDGDTIYYIKGLLGKPELWSLRLTSKSHPRFVCALPAGSAASWDLDDTGVYFIDSASQPTASLSFFEFAPGDRSLIAPLGKRAFNGGLARGRGNGWLYVQADGGGSDHVFVEVGPVNAFSTRNEPPI